MVKNDIINPDSSKLSCPDCILVVILKNCEPKLSCIPGEIFNMYLKESCFPGCWKVSSVVPVFKNDGEKFTTKNPVSLLFVVNKVLEKFINSRLIS